MGSSFTQQNIHAFMVSFPGQGHVNPLLRLGRRLANVGLFITFCAPETAGSRIRKTSNITDGEPTAVGSGFIRFEFFDEGWDPNRDDNSGYLNQLELVGREKIPELVRKQAELGRPVSCLINNPFIPWVADVAQNLNIPSAMLWVQSCTCFSAYYHFYHNLVPFPTEEQPEIDVLLPFLPLLKYDEIPDFLHPRTPYSFLRENILGQFANLSLPFCILMDTFEELEHDNIQYMSKIINLPIRTVGPLFKDPQISESKHSKMVRADFFAVEEDCIVWLDSKPPRTVVYISFGSVVQIPQEQVDEIAKGLVNSCVSFLWVVRPPPPNHNCTPHILPEGFAEKVGERGKIVQWSPQEEVLAHPSTACFVTHCGWNSAMEALASGVPVVALPQWGDQVTNAKFMVDVYKVGVRMGRGEAAGRIVPGDEVAKVLQEAVSGEQAAEIRENAVKWIKAASAAAAPGGSSFENMHHFVNDLAGVNAKNNT